MLNKHYVYYAALLFVILVGFYLWHKSEIAVALAEERAKAQESIVQQAKDAIAASEKAHAQAISQLAAERSKPATVQTVVKYLPAPLPQGSEVKIQKLPDVPAPQLVLSGDVTKNLQAIQEMEIAHRECDVNLKSCGEKRTAQDQQIKALTAERDTWKRATQGGSKFHRFGKALKVIGCAGGGAALGSLLGKSRGAAIGGAAAAGACEISF